MKSDQKDLGQPTGGSRISGLFGPAFRRRWALVTAFGVAAYVVGLLELSVPQPTEHTYVHPGLAGSGNAPCAAGSCVGEFCDSAGFIFRSYCYTVQPADFHPTLPPWSFDGRKVCFAGACDADFLPGTPELNVWSTRDCRAVAIQANDTMYTTRTYDLILASKAITWAGLPMGFVLVLIGTVLYRTREKTSRLVTTTYLSGMASQAGLIGLYILEALQLGLGPQGLFLVGSPWTLADWMTVNVLTFALLAVAIGGLAVAATCRASIVGGGGLRNPRPDLVRAQIALLLAGGLGAVLVLYALWAIVHSVVDLFPGC
jgi:hypothetical protein